MTRHKLSPGAVDVTHAVNIRFACTDVNRESVDRDNDRDSKSKKLYEFSFFSFDIIYKLNQPSTDENNKKKKKRERVLQSAVLQYFVLISELYYS